MADGLLKRIARAIRNEPRDDPRQHQQTVVTTPRAGGDISPYRTVNRDRALGHTVAPPGARQQWELYRAREESRDLALTSPIWGGYVHFARVQALGYEFSRLQFDRLTRADKTRLKEPIGWLRREWNIYQRLRGVGGTGQNVHQLAGSVLHHVDVDGDCFMLPRMANGRRVWDLHPGDALSESTFHIGLGEQGGNRQLGVEIDAHGKPLAYYFGEGGKLSALNWGYPNYSSSTKEVRVSAAMVEHVRDRSGEITAVRGWPRCTTSLDDIARLDEWYSALVRSATLRASIGLALEKETSFGSPADVGGGLAPGDIARQLGQEGTMSQGATAEALGAEDLRPYQEFVGKWGGIMEMLPGYKVKEVGTGAPTAQEAAAIGMLERRVCAALRTTPATLLGDYKALSFSGGQLGHMQERQAIEDRQMILSMQFYTPVYSGFFLDRWLPMQSMFSQLTPDDFKLLGWPAFVLRNYPIVDKTKLVAPILMAWEKGAMTYPEMRRELGWSGVNVEETIEEWKENRRMLGLPETPSQGGPAFGGDDEPLDDDDDGNDDNDDDEESDDDDGDS